MYGWLTFYHQGHEASKDCKPYMTDLQIRVQNVSTTVELSSKCQGSFTIFGEGPYLRLFCVDSVKALIGSFNRDKAQVAFTIYCVFS